MPRSQLRTRPGARLAHWLILFLLLAGCRGPAVGLDVGAGPLHQAAADGEIDEVERLIDAGTPVDVRATGSRGTPLHFAARDGRYAVARLLLERGADVDAETQYGATPLHLAAGTSALACVFPEREDSAGLTEGHLAVARLLLESKAMVDPRNREGITPLHGAAMCNDVEIASLLIAKGANINNRGHQYSVLDQAMYFGPDVAKLLVAGGVEVNTFVPFSGETPLMTAIEKHRVDLIPMLLEAGADPNALNRRNQWTALDYAIYYCEPDLVEILREYGAKAGGKMGEPGTPLRARPCPEFPDREH